MREVLLAVVMLSAGLAGCIGDGGESLDSTEANGTGGSAPVADTSEANATDDTSAASNETDDLNPWQRGLADHYPTPDVAKQRSAEERRANVAEPGDPAFAPFDATVEAWMKAQNVTAGQLSLMKDGQLRYERGYGHVDRAQTQPANASTMFRIASVTKPMTAALVSLQVEQGLYNWADPVFCLGDEPPANCRLPIDPHRSNPVDDERLADIEVQDLLAHACGYWAPHETFTFGGGAIEVANELGVEPPPSAWRTAQYLIGEELSYDPGQDERYSNVCYILAGLVAEAATGAELGALYDAYLFRPLEISGDIEPGRTLPDERSPREPLYHCEEKAKSVFDPNETVCEPNGEWSMQTHLANGGLIATAEAVAAVYEAYTEHAPEWLRLELGAVEADCSPTATCRWHSGAFPGTAAVSGVIQEEGSKAQFVVLFNKLVNAGGFAGCPPPGVPGLDCTVGDLHYGMFPLTATWAGSPDAPVLPDPS